MKYLLFIVLLVAVVITAGCITQNNNAAVPSTPQIVYQTILVTPTPTPAKLEIVYITVTVPVTAGVEQSTSNLQMIGNVYGLASNPSAGIDEIKFSVGLAPRVQPIDLTKMKIMFSTPNTAPVILTQGAMVSKTVFTTKLNGAITVDSMSTNDQVEIAFKTDLIKTNTNIRIELKPAVGASLPFSKTAPATIAAVNVLY